MKNIPKLDLNFVSNAVDVLLTTGARQVTVYQHPLLCVKATRRYKPDKHASRIDIVLTIGVPNYEGRLFASRCLAAKEPFPIKKPQLKFWPKPKKKQEIRYA